MAKSNEPSIDVKLFVDKEKERVVFAESGEDFVDVLFSFLTLPMATIVRLLGKQSFLGCFDELYKSVESLSTDHFQTKACKTMLLHPINAAAAQCDLLTIKLDRTDHKSVYMCPSETVSDGSYNNHMFSSVPDVVCKCGQVMQRVGERKNSSTAVEAEGGGIFVKGGVKFIITDDLHVAPASTSLMLCLASRMGIRDPANLEERDFAFSVDKIKGLLKRSLTSKNPLTGVCLDAAEAADGVKLDELELHDDRAPTLNDELELETSGVKIKLLQTKSNSSVLYAEAGDEFVDLIFSFLMLPLGSVLKMVGCCSPNGCIDALYKSIEGSAKGWIKSECQDLLLSPMVAPYFGCGNILRVQEVAPRSVPAYRCRKCFNPTLLSGWCAICRKEGSYVLASELNPKSPSGGRDAYVKSPGKFMVTDDLQVLPLSFAGTIRVLRETKIPLEKLEEKEFTLTKLQVLKMLTAALATRAALSNVFMPPKKMKNLGIY